MCINGISLPPNELTSVFIKSGGQQSFHCNNRRMPSMTLTFLLSVYFIYSYDNWIRNWSFIMTTSTNGIDYCHRTQTIVYYVLYNFVAKNMHHLHSYCILTRSIHTTDCRIDINSNKWNMLMHTAQRRSHWIIILSSLVDAYKLGGWSTMYITDNAVLLCCKYM